MEYQQFVKYVQDKAEIQDKPQAIKAIQATLQTLSERLVQQDAEDLAALLPRELQIVMKEPENRGRFDLQEFLQRVAKRERVNPAQVEPHVRAVLEVLCSAVDRSDNDDVLARLPREFWPLFGRRSETIH